MAEGNKCGENEKVFFSTSGSEEEVIDRADKFVEQYITLMGNRYFAKGLSIFSRHKV